MQLVVFVCFQSPPPQVLEWDEEYKEQKVQANILIKNAENLIKENI